MTAAGFGRRHCRQLFGLSRAQVRRIAARAVAEQHAFASYQWCIECLALGGG